VAKKEDSNGLWCLKIVLVIALALTALALCGPIVAALVFFAMAVLDKLSQIAKQRSDNDE